MTLFGCPEEDRCLTTFEGQMPTDALPAPRQYLVSQAECPSPSGEPIFRILS